MQLWAGGPYWATTNIGASTPEEYGYYFAWGYTKGCVRNSGNDGWVLASDGKTAKQLNTTDFPDLSPASGDVLEAAKDAATQNWGSGWRMPTQTDFDNLKSYCDITYVKTGTMGVRFTGKDSYSGNSIFLPAAGCGVGSGLGSAGSGCLYWSSTQAFSDAYLLNSHTVGSSYVSSASKYYGCPVRPVRSSL